MHAPVDGSPTEEVHQGRGAGSVNTLFPQQQFYVGTDFIGGEDQGYIACP